jgi:hypothetical protein
LICKEVFGIFLFFIWKKGKEMGRERRLREKSLRNIKEIGKNS